MLILVGGISGRDNLFIIFIAYYSGTQVVDT